MHLSQFCCIWSKVHTLMQWYIQLNHERSRRTKKWNKCVANDKWPIKIHHNNRLDQWHAYYSAHSRKKIIHQNNKFDQWHAYYSVHSRKKCNQLCIWCEVHILMQWYIQLKHKKTKRIENWNRCVTNDKWPIKIHRNKKLEQWHASYGIHSKKKCSQFKDLLPMK